MGERPSPEHEQPETIELVTEEARIAREKFVRIANEMQFCQEVLDALNEFVEAIRAEEQLDLVTPVGLLAGYHLANAYADAGYTEMAIETAAEGLRIDNNEYRSPKPMSIWQKRFSDILISLGQEPLEAIYDDMKRHSVPPT